MADLSSENGAGSLDPRQPEKGQAIDISDNCSDISDVTAATFSVLKTPCPSSLQQKLLFAYIGILDLAHLLGNRFRPYFIVDIMEDNFQTMSLKRLRSIDLRVNLLTLRFVDREVDRRFVRSMVYESGLFSSALPLAFMLLYIYTYHSITLASYYRGGYIEEWLAIPVFAIFNILPLSLWLAYATRIFDISLSASIHHDVLILRQSNKLSSHLDTDIGTREFVDFNRNKATVTHSKPSPECIDDLDVRAKSISYLAFLWSLCAVLSAIAFLWLWGLYNVPCDFFCIGGTSLNGLTALSVFVLPLYCSLTLPLTYDFIFVIDLVSKLALSLMILHRIPMDSFPIYHFIALVIMSLHMAFANRMFSKRAVVSFAINEIISLAVVNQRDNITL